MTRLPTVVSFYLHCYNEIPFDLCRFTEKSCEVKEGSTFSSNKSWFDRVKIRAAPHNIKMNGEAAISDEYAAAIFEPTLKKHVEECGYSAKQVINYDKTDLYWENMSCTAVIAKKEKTVPEF